MKGSSPTDTADCKRSIDLGKWFKTQYGLPLPLGANALRRDLSPKCEQNVRV